MKKSISFSKFLALPEEVQEVLQQFDYSYTPEDFNKNYPAEEQNRRIKKKLVELEGLLKRFDFWFNMISGDLRDWKKQNELQIMIKKLVDMIGKPAENLYWKYATKAGVKRAKYEGRNKYNGIPIAERKKDTKLNDYETYLQSKMDEWKINSLEELEAEPLKRFWAEVDKGWINDDYKVSTNLP